MKSEVKEFLITIAIALTIVIIFQLSLQISPVVFSSMEPTLHEGQVLVINKLAYSFGGEPRRGDIIIFTPPDEVAGEGELVKRVIGLPGEVIEIRDGLVYVHEPSGDSFRLNESYVAYAPTYDYVSKPIEPAHYFVLGDNRSNSVDSRNGWTVPRDNIVGKAWLSIWPPSEWGLAPNYSLPQRASDLPEYSGA